MVSIYGGTGFIGSKYHQMFGGTIVNRESVVSPSNDLLYFISTTNNYNVFEQPLIVTNGSTCKLTPHFLNRNEYANRLNQNPVLPGHQTIIVSKNNRNSLPIFFVNLNINISLPVD